MVKILLLYGLLLPPRVGLLPVQLPELDTLEPAVRRQLTTLQESFTKLSANSLTTGGELTEGYGLLAQLYHAYQFSEAAESCYLNAVRLAPNQFRWIYLLGSLYQKTGRLQESLLYFKAARKLDQEYFPAVINLGLVYLQLDRVESARQEFERALTMKPESATANFGLGKVALVSHQFDEAITHFEAALEKVPDANRIQYLLGMAYRGKGDLNNAKAHLALRGEVGVRVPDPMVDALQGLLQGERVQMVQGHIAFNVGRFEEAAAAFRRAAEANPKSIVARVNLGTALVKMGKADEAMEQFQEALHLNPVNPTAHYNLGVLLLDRKDYSGAIEHFRGVMVVNPRDVDSNFRLATALLKTGQNEEAATYFSRVLTLAPGHEDALMEAVNLLLKAGRYKEAVERLDAANRRFPEHGRTAHALAVVLASCPDESLRDGKRALNLAQKVYAASKTLRHGITVAKALAEVGRCEEAAKLQRKLLEATKAATQGSGGSKLVSRLSADLTRFSAGPPCRP